MVSPQTVFTYPLHHAKLQVLLHVCHLHVKPQYITWYSSKCKATNLTTWCHHAKLQVFTCLYLHVNPQLHYWYSQNAHGVTANSLYLSSSPCKATNLTTWCHRKQSLLILFTMQSYKSYLSWCHHAKLQVPCGVTANSLYLSSSPCKATNLTTWCHRKQSLLILFTMQSYKSYYMVSPQTVFTYPLHHAKLQIVFTLTMQSYKYLSVLHHGHSTLLVLSKCTWCHRKQSLLILFTMQSYKSYYMVSPQTVFTYPLHHAKLQILLHGVTANSLYLLSSPCKATNLTTWCHRKQSLLILFTMQSYKSYYMVSPQTVFTYPLHHAKLQILLHGVTANSLYLSSSPCKATNLTTWCHRKQSLLILFTMQSYKSYYMVSPQTVFTYPLHHAKLQILLHGVTANSLYLSFSPCKATNLTTWCHRKQSLLILFSMQSYKSYYMVSPQTVFTYSLHHAKLQVLHMRKHKYDAYCFIIR